MEVSTKKQEETNTKMKLPMIMFQLFLVLFMYAHSYSYCIYFCSSVVFLCSFPSDGIYSIHHYTNNNIKPKVSDCAVGLCCTPVHNGRRNSVSYRVQV